MRNFATLLLSALSSLLLLSLLNPLSLFPQVSVHKKILLRGFDGSPLTLESGIPYSPKRTCGACHHYQRITSGYHFQQGRTDGTGKIMISDSFDLKHPWNLSPGMYGRHFAASMDSSQLAKKVNQHPSEIDKSSFYFVQHCGTCHPGGGWSEYDRRGNLYYDEESRKFGYELSRDNPLLDGDYTPLSSGDVNYGSPWDRSGVSEADCLICHLKGYQWRERAAAFRARLFRYGPAAGAGWAEVKLSEAAAGHLKSDEVKIDYGKKEVADFDRLHLQIVKRTPDENCWFCHAMADGKRRGRLWSPETDIHKAKGMDCLSCHPSDKEHNFAKGNTLQGSVRDDLDHTMHSCEACHYKGKDKRAPRYKHPFSPRHMRRLACQTCHTPFQMASADLVYDHASTGSTIVYETSRFLSNDPLDPKRSALSGNPVAWYPALRESKGKIVPVKPLIVIYWGDWDERTNVFRPIPLWKIRDLTRPPLADDDGDGIPEINSLEEIKAFLNALKAKDKFGTPIASHPALVKGGFLYHLDEKGEVEKIKHDQAGPLDFSLSHNVMSGVNVIGSRGCKDCHTKNSPFFLRKILIDSFDEKGKPVYLEAWERLGIDPEKLDRLLLEQ